jgi:hypothetical protein
VQRITENLFARWCAESGTAPMDRVVAEARTAQRNETEQASDFAALLTSLNFSGSAAAEVADALSAQARQGQAGTEAVTAICWRLYDEAIRKLCVQTGHVLIARLMLYRIGEDTAMFRTLISREVLQEALRPHHGALGTQTPALGAIERLRAEMEPFLPLIYRMGEFDWWHIPADKRSALEPSESATVSNLDRQLDLVFQRVLRGLDRYQFNEVDVDVWRNVYQHYLPWDERQRLGGFYTPDELVELVLDLVEYSPGQKDLAERPFIDLASGSGAFVVGALARLLKHFEIYGPPNLPSGRQPEWTRAEAELRAIQDCLHAIDLHPFAAFLTTINVLFLILPRYKLVKDKNPQFVFEPTILAHDSLILSPQEVAIYAAMEEQLNGRVQRAAEDHRRYVALLRKRFDYVIGNPPWSGILKGPLAAVYDETQKRRLKASYHGIAVGKYDIYGLFMDRALRMLKPGGVFGLVTQDTYLDKDWAGGLRRKLSTKATIRTILDLNPCGQLFFHAMNTPAISVVANCEPGSKHKILVGLTHRPAGFEALDESARRQRVASLVRKAINEAPRSGHVREQFVECFFVPQSRFSRAGGDRWNLAPESQRTTKGDSSWVSVSELLEPFQGVTPGGEGCLDLFVMEDVQSKSAGFERDLIHPVVKGLDVTPWRCRRTGLVLLYPYKLTSSGPKPAFDLAAWKATQSELVGALRTLVDALDFTSPIDSAEERYRRAHRRNGELLQLLLTHREGLGLVEYPTVASYLISHFEKLSSRMFEKRNIVEWGKQWYEYHRPRKPSLMLRAPKIISPRLTRAVRFAIDTHGIVPQDSCIALVPSEKTARAWQDFRNQIAGATGRQLNETAAFQIVLAFLNSDYAQRLLTTGRRPTPKGSYQIAEDFLADVRIPRLTTAKVVARRLADTKLLCGSRSKPDPAALQRINETVSALVEGRKRVKFVRS